MTRSEELGRIKNGLIAEAEVVWPEMVIDGGDRLVKPTNDVGESKPPRISRLSENTQAGVLRQRAGGPAILPVLGQPSMRQLMMHMCRIEKSDEDTRIEECNHGYSDSSLNLATSSGGTTRSVAGMTSNPFRL